MTYQKRILFIVPPFQTGWGGIPPSVLFLSRGLYASDYESDVLDPMGLIQDVHLLQSLPETRSKGEKNSIQFNQYSAVVYVGQWHSLMNLLKVLLRKSPRSNFFIATKGGVCKVEFSRLRDYKKYLYFFVIGFPIFLFAKAIVFSSELEKRSTVYPLQYLSDIARVIPDVYKLESRRIQESGTRRSGDRIRLSFLAEISPRKGLKEVVDGVSYFLRCNPGFYSKIELCVGGVSRPGSEDYLSQVKSNLEKLGLRDVVSFLGFIGPDAKAEFYRRTDVFLAASAFESFGLTVLEALEYGCPVVAHSKIGVLEYVSGLAGLFIVDSLSPEDVSDGILSALSYELSADREVDVENRISHLNEIAIKKWVSVLG